MASIFKAFCDENRIRILKMLRGGEKCACRLLEALAVTQPTLSHHMKILCDSGIVVNEKVVSMGRVLSAAEVEQLLREAGV